MALDPELAEKLRNRFTKTAESNDMLSSISKVTSKYSEQQSPFQQAINERMPYTLGSPSRIAYDVAGQAQKPKSAVLEFAKAAPGAASKAWKDWTESEQKRRADQTFAQEASTELVKRPIKILAKGAGMIAGGLSDIGKTFMELGGTYARAALTDETIGEASIKMQKYLHGDNARQELEKKIFGFKSQSYGDWQEGISKYLEDSNALPIEKKTLPIILPILALSSDLMPGGKPAMIAVRKTIEEMAKETGETALRKMLRDLAVPDEVAERALPRLIEANNVNKVKAVLREELEPVTKSLTRELATELGKGAEEVAPTVARTADDMTPTVVRTADEMTPTVMRTADEAIPAASRTSEDVAPAIAKATDNIAKIASEMKQAGKTFEEFVREQNIPEVRMVDVADLPERARAVGMPAKQFDELASSIRQNGIQDPIVMNGDMVLDGMRRAMVAEELGIRQVPVIQAPVSSAKEAAAISKNYRETVSRLQDIWNNATTPRAPQPQAQTLTPPARTPATIPGSGGMSGTKERKFITSVKEELPEVGKKIVGGQYIPRSTDELAREARELIENNLTEALRVAKEETDDRAIAVASELLKYYNERGLYEEAAELAMEIAPKLTELGRAVQAASILANLTPEGQIKLLARELNKWNNAHPGKPARKITADEAEHITSEMKEIEAMEMGIDREIRFHRLRMYVGNIVPSPWWKKVVNVWKAGLLTGIKTTGLNIYSNAFHGIFEIVKDIPATAVDSVASLFTGKRTKALTLRGIMPGMDKGFERGWIMFRTGYDERNSIKKLDYRRISFGKGRVAKVFQAYTDMVFNTIAAQDQPFYYGAVARSIADQSIALGKTKGLKGKELRKFVDDTIQDPPEEIVLTAINDGKTAVFQQETILGNAAKTIQRIPGAEFIVPFGQTPGAVATQVLNYTPLGTIGEITRQINRGVFDQRKFSEAVGRGAVGVGIAYLGWQLIQNDMVALDYPKDEREREQWKNEGKKPNSILINGKWRSPATLGPLGNVLLIGAHLGKAYEETGSVSESVARGGAGALKSFTEQTFLTGISSLANAINDPERNATSFVAGLVSSAVPTIINDIAKASDPLDRRTKDDSAIQTVLNRVQSRIPLLREELEPVMTSLGEEKQREGTWWETMFDPTRPSEAINSLVIDEIKRLTDIGYNVSPTMQGSSIGYNSLSQEENTLMWAEVGSITREKLERLFANPAYQALSDEQKAKKVDEFIRKSKDVGRAKTILRLTRGMSQEEYTNALKLYKHSSGEKLLTEDVYRELVKLQDQ